MMSNEKSEILGLICSDGNCRIYKTTYPEFDKRRNKTYTRHQKKRIIEFANTDVKLLKHFISLLNKEYKYRPKITISNKNVFRVCITKNSVIDDLSRNMMFGTLGWKVPNEVFYGNRNIQSAFIRGIFDGDGSVDLAGQTTPRVRISSQNLKGLERIMKMLCKLNIRSKVNGPYKNYGKNSNYELLLKTSSINRFIKIIKSNHSKKKARFDKIAGVS